jgi:hypothetical protein
MSQTRQQILILHLALPSLESDTVAWALYDGATPSGTPPMLSGDSYEPPYPSVLEAIPMDMSTKADISPMSMSWNER